MLYNNLKLSKIAPKNNKKCSKFVANLAKISKISNNCILSFLGGLVFVVLTQKNHK